MQASATRNLGGSPGRSAAAPAAGARRGARRYLFWGFILAAALDFKGLSSGGAYQLTLFGIGVLAFLLYLMGAPRIRGRYRLLNQVTLLWGVFLLSTALVAWYWQVEASNYIHVVIPYILFGEALLFVNFLMEESEDNSGFILQAIYISSFISSIVVLLSTLFVRQTALEGARYNLLSLLNFSLFGISFCRFLFRGFRSGLLNLAGLVWPLAVMFLSVTRGNLQVLAVVMMGSLAIAVWPPAWFHPGARARARRNLLLGSVLALASVLILAISLPTFTQKWISRMSTLGSGSGQTDATTYTRIAEISGEWNQIRGSWAKIILGAGMGSNVYWDEKYLKGLQGLGMHYRVETAEPGHVSWFYNFYSQGLLFGWTVPLVLGLALVRSFRRQAPVRSRIAGVCVLGFAIAMNTGNALNTRSVGQVLGLTVALALAWEPEKRRRPAVLAVPGAPPRRESLPAPQLPAR